LTLDIQAVGGLFGLPFRELYDYLKDLKETREVKKQLGNVLQSLDLYKASIKASKESGVALWAKWDSLKVPTSSHDAGDFTRAWIENTNDLSDVLASVRMFAKECNDLISGDFEAFMSRVKIRRPIVHDFLTFFGRNYNLKTGLVDLTRLPMLVRMYGPKIGWKENKELTKEVEDERKRVTDTIEKARAIIHQRSLPRIIDRRLIKDYLDAVRRLAKEMKTLQSNKIVDRQLWENAPSWFVGIMELWEELQKALPELAAASIVAYRRYRPARNVRTMQRATN